MIDSRLSGLRKLTVSERIAELARRKILTSDDARTLLSGRQVVSVHAADKMVENVIGVFGLPLAIAPNFIVNGRERIVPLVIEEPSVVAALSYAAALARKNGGFSASGDASLLAGQIHLIGVSDAAAAQQAIVGAKTALLEQANNVHPRLKNRGGGARDIEVRSLQLQSGQPLLVVHVLVDTCDAMGANLVNSICESLAPEVASLCGGRVALRILSNLTDRARVKARVAFDVEQLATDTMSGAAVRDGIVVASDIAMVDPYRAATHNKGVMNGIDAVAIATGNDWRALQAGAHAFAARDGGYSAITRWSTGANDELVGEIDVPLKVGIVGGTLAANPAAKLGLAITAVESALELAEIMVAVGLAQNFSALRALATSGIQQGHMRMHARSVASAAGAPAGRIDEVVEKLVASGEVKDWKAGEIVASLGDVEQDSDAVSAAAAGKIILLGEHAVVYGQHALAVPIPGAVQASVSRLEHNTRLTILEWGLQLEIDERANDGAAAVVRQIVKLLHLEDVHFDIRVSSSLPRGMGLGSSAAIAVAVTRAVAKCMQIDLDDTAVNEIAFACEKLSHGTPSGVDNTIACYGNAMLFRNSEKLDCESLSVATNLPLVVGVSHCAGPTMEQVAGVRHRRNEHTRYYDAIFEQINRLSVDGARALVSENYSELGSMMNICQGLLNAIEVSTPELEEMIHIARDAGALGAKLTGAGGGGSVVALCPGREVEVRTALQQAGFNTLIAAEAGDSA